MKLLTTEKAVHLIIAIEGIDGSGKGTQAKMLAEHLEKCSYEARVYAFPQYQHTTFGKEVARYLNGDFGSMEEVHPKFAAILYALDRRETMDRLSLDLELGRIIICDRYTPSNIAHQSAKMGEDSFVEFSHWVENLEYNILNIIKPDLVLLLDMPESLAQFHVKLKRGRSYTLRQLDLHEENLQYLGRVRQRYLRMAEDNWMVINCMSDSGPRAMDSIHKEIVDCVIKFLDLRGRLGGSEQEAGNS